MANQNGSRGCISVIGAFALSALDICIGNAYLVLEGCGLPLATTARRVRVTGCVVSSVSCMGSQKVTLLVVFLWLLGEGGASATWSTLDVAAKLGTLNATMPNLSDVA